MYSLKRKFVMLIVVSLWIYIAFIRPFKNELPLINEDDYMKPGSLDLPNVVVHLDLQAMPPRIPYLLEFLDRIRPIGANGLLIEYGDTYPFDGFIKYMSAEEAYNEEELTQFLKEANHKGFNVIPFVDTLVHLDLALEDFRHSREPGSTDSICPTESQSTAILTNLLEQIINFHAIIPLEYIHIGCGKEKLNYFKACKGRSRSDLDVYINHVRTVSNIIKSLKLDVKILMWDDIFRYISSEDEVKAKKLHDVEIVCRDYNPKIKVSFKTLLTYQKVFKNTWAASAYRGADGPDFKIPKLISRYQNNLAWMKLVNIYKDTYKFKGIILSGSHKHTECEILPAALPSLIMNLILIKQIMIVDDEARNLKALEFFDMFVQKDLKIALKCQDPIPFELTYQSMERCTFEEHTLVSSFLCYDLKDEDITSLFNMINHDYSTLFNNMFNYNTFLFLHHCLKEYKLKSYILNLTSQLGSYFGTRKNTYNCIQYLIDKVSKERSIWNMNNS